MGIEPPQSRTIVDDGSVAYPIRKSYRTCARRGCFLMASGLLGGSRRSSPENSLRKSEVLSGRAPRSRITPRMMVSTDAGLPSTGRTRRGKTGLDRKPSADTEPVNPGASHHRYLTRCLRGAGLGSGGLTHRHCDRRMQRGRASRYQTLARRHFEFTHVQPVAGDWSLRVGGIADDAATRQS